MTTELPEPRSRKEAYLAKAAGVEVSELPTPESREELYLNAIAEGGGGGGGTSNFNQLTNRPKYNSAEMTGDTNIPAVPTVSQSTGQSTTEVMSQKAVTSTINTRLDNLTLLKITQTAYDNLQTYDANTLYIITGA